MEPNKSMENNKNMWIGIGAIAVIVLIFVFLSMNKKETIEDENVNTTGDQITVVGEEDLTDGSVNATTPVATLSYQQALVKYKDARIQLDNTCQASPDKMTFKNGTSIMIDNRAPVARTVKVGSTFSIKAYGFKIVKLSSDTIPTTWLVDCDGSQNVSTILIQA